LTCCLVAAFVAETPAPGIGILPDFTTPRTILPEGKAAEVCPAVCALDQSA
jgi:hypothetical protein